MFFRTMLTAALILPVMLFADDITITDDFIQAGETETLTADNNYTLSGFVFVEDGAVLEIEAGTVIKAEPGQGEDASALIIAKGGKIMAEGTATDPIIFTSVSDDVSDPSDLTAEDRGLWGGVIVLGKAPLNFVDGGGGSNNIEGIPESETRGAYGGDDPDDNSGTMRYVSIRHGGSVIGADNEINGLTMGAVGSGTTIEYIEVFANKDDGFEWFGGTVNTRYLISAFCGDDAFDYDQGFRGNGQFWFAVQGEDVGNHGGEHDGGPSTCETCTPYAIPTIYNATYIGSGADSDNAKSNGMILRDNAGGRYINSIFTEFTGVMLKVEDLADGGDSKKMFEDGNIEFSNNILYNFGAGETFADLVMFANSDGEATGNPDALIEAFEDWNNEIVDPSLAGTGKAEGELDPRPDDGSSAFENVATPDDDWFDAVDYKGAFSSEDTWAQGWSILSQSGILEDSESGQVAVGDTLTDDDIQEGQTVTLQQGNEYILKGFVFVEDGSTLNIEEGVVIKALPGQGEDASALVVARGGQINAEGTEDNPIIFTSVSDDVSDPDDLTAEDRGLWGGVIVLGKAPLNFVDGGGGSNNIEGIPESETRGAYGGDDPDDNSGTMRYVSIRHGGSVIGADNEINGLTMGAVGSGTTIEYIEVFANKDDGFEWFGGTVNSKYLVSA
ncbi:MAG: T9SS C-terminal target domain-containing protein, partial [Chitinivibrionales bacterium]